MFLKKYLFISIICIGFLSNGIAQKNVSGNSLLFKINSSVGINKAKAYCIAANYYKLIKPDTSLILANKALELNLEFKNDTVQANALGNIAECYSSKSQFDSAVIYYLKAILIAEKIGSLKKIASYNNGLGMIFYQLGDITKAILYMQKAANIKLKEGDMLYYATINCNIAGALQRLGKYNEAIAILRDSELKLKNFNNVEILANLYNSLGSAYQLQSKNIDSVEYYYQKCIDLITNPDLDFYRLAAYINISDVYIEKNKFELAEQNLFKALAIINKLNRSLEKINVYQNLSTLYEKKKDFVKALAYKKLQLNLGDSLLNIDKEQTIQELDTKYQTEKKDLQIKEQELTIEKDTNKRNRLIILFTIVLFVLILVTVYFLFKKQTQKAIEKAKQKFFSNVVHEIRTPLTTIQAPLNILKQSKNSVDELYHIDLAEKSILRLNELVNQMLDISKIETNKYVLSEAFGDISVFFNELLKNYSVMANEKNLSLVIQTNYQNNLVSFDKDALEKITGNLLSNAIKYTQSGKQLGIIINTIEFENHLQLEISVWDTGTGISKPDQQKIFERFYRSSSTLKNTKGTGIGLSLVKDLVDVYNGKINLQSELNKGSTFTVSLQLKKQNSFAFDSEVSNQNEVANLSVAESQQILLIEDDSAILDFTARLLQSHNYMVIKASNGIEALQLLEKTLPDLIISDLMMPQMDGVQFLNHLKNNAATNHIPVIFLSAKAAATSRLEILNLGAQAYLTKPFLPDELVAMVKNQLAILIKKQVEFEQTIKEPEKTAEEKFIGTEPYTQKLFKLIFSKLDSHELSVENLADLMATNRSHFQRKVKAITGFSPSELIKFIRLEKAKEFLLDKKGNITEVAYMVGFSSQSYFTKCFSEYYKKSPTEMLQNH